jgi:hypothetical protein
LQGKYRHALEVMAGSTPLVDPWTVHLPAVVVKGISHLSPRRDRTAPSDSKPRTSALPPDWSATTPNTSSGCASSASSRRRPTALLEDAWVDDLSFRLEEMFRDAAFTIEFSC